MAAREAVDVFTQVCGGVWARKEEGGLLPGLGETPPACTAACVHEVGCQGIAAATGALTRVPTSSQLYEADHPEAAKPQATAAPQDVAAALAQEIDELKDTKKALFYYRSTGIHSTVFVEIKYEGSPGPRELVTRACQRARAEGRSGTRLCNRFYPIDATCYASLDKIREAGAALAAEHFPTPEGKPTEAAGIQASRLKGVGKGGGKRRGAGGCAHSTPWHARCGVNPAGPPRVCP